MSLSMADLLAKQSKSTHLKLARGQRIDGEIIAITDSEVILDLKAKSEGAIPLKDFNFDEATALKIGQKIPAFIISTESESGQIILSTHVASDTKSGQLQSKFRKFEDAKAKGSVLVGKGIELNKGGIVVDVGGFRGFLPSSQANPTVASNLESLIGKDVEVIVIEVDPSQNRLILSQKLKVSEATKQALSKLKVGDKVKGKIEAVLPFGLFLSLAEGVEGLVHISEVSWEKTDNLNAFTQGDELEAKVISTDANTGRVNLSIKQLQEDPFEKLASDYQSDDVVKATVTKITSGGVSAIIGEGIEAFVPSEKLDPTQTYEVEQSYNFLVDNVDKRHRRINLAPFITTTEGLIYK